MINIPAKKYLVPSAAEIQLSPKFTEKAFEARDFTVTNKYQKSVKTLIWLKYQKLLKKRGML